MIGVTTYLLDTDVLSETAKVKPNARVVEWIGGLDRMQVSAVSVFELARGIQRLRAGRQRAFLEAWLDHLTARAEVVSFDHRTALAAASLEASGRARGRGIDLRDLFILASAQSVGAGIATGNVSHFRAWGVPLVDPFERG